LDSLFNQPMQLHVQEPYDTFIKEGKKTVEGRLAKDKYLQLKRGEVIQINGIKASVLSIKKYPTFKEMIKSEGIENVIPDIKELEDATNVYYKFYTKEEEAKYQVIAIRIKVITKLDN
jgi:ASC-1-like (ASCH) protein